MPIEGLGQKSCNQFGLVFGLVEAMVVGVVGLIPDVPGEDAVVFRKGGDDADDIFLELAARRTGSESSAAPGLWTQPELWMPGMGGC